MPTSLRLNGDRDRAAQWWGEAKRILFQLKTNLGYLGVDTGWRSRVCVDGTIIRVGQLQGFDIVEINSPFAPAVPEEQWEELLFILCCRSNDPENALNILYTIEVDETGLIITTEVSDDTLENLEEFTLVDSTTGTAVGIVSETERKEHVILYGLSYGNWLITQIVGGLSWNMDITYEDRYLYAHSGLIYIYQIPFRMVNGFRRTGGRSSFYNPHLYFPKLVTGNPVWTVLDHNTYAAVADVIGKNNISLDTDKRYAESWGERICEQENAPYSFNLGGITNPFQNIDIPHINWMGRYSWPIIGTLNARKVPKVYSMKYEDDAGTQTTEDYWTETLVYAETAGNGTAAGVTYWPIAAIGNKKFLYLKNTLTQETTFSDVIVEGPPWPDWTGTRTISSTNTEDITQDFYAGDVLIESLLSEFERINTSILVVTPTGVYPTGTYSYTIVETFSGTFRWVEVLDYSNHQGNLIVFYKKITEVIDWPRSYSDAGVYAPPPNRTVTDSRIGTSTRKVEYYLATIIDGILTKRLLETFDSTCDTAMSFTGEDDGVDITGNRIVTSEEDGVGERIYGVSCQMNSDYAVFSFNKETFDGTGANAEDYFKAKVSVHKIYNWFGDGLPATDPIPYPFPIEDMNVIIETATEAWIDGHFCVGAIGVEDNPGAYGYSEFDNQIDIVSATGIIEDKRRV